MNALHSSRPGLGLYASVLILTLVVSALGCRSQSLDDVDQLVASTVVSSGQELGQTMKYIESFERFNMAEFRDKVNSGLNRWMSSSENPSSNWTRDSLVDTLPEGLAEQTGVRNLDSTKFSGNDAYYLQQCFWIEEIAERVGADYTILNHEYYLQMAIDGKSDEDKTAIRDADDPLARVVAMLNPDLAASDDSAASEQARQLARAMELFDWTIRNIQLRETPEWPSPENIEALSLVSDPDPAAWPPALGAYGPGYVRYPWKTLNYGKGDYLDRARIFSLLCQSIDLPVAMLAVKNPEGEGTRPYVEWCPAVLIGGKAYLFDTLLGIPLPGETPGSIATLSGVRSNPQLLTDLNLTPEESPEARVDYRIRESDLDNLVALAVAGPASLSKRMAMVESSLVGDTRLKLAMNMDRFRDAVASIEGLGDMAVWHIAFSTDAFREQVELANNLARIGDPEIQAKLDWLATDEIYVDNFVNFRTARNMYLRGYFETDRKADQRSAFSYYFAFMYTDDEISTIDVDTELQKRLGLRAGPGQDVRSWNSQLVFMKSNMRLIRADAAFFMALANFENGNPIPAMNWLDNQLPIMDAEKRWEEWRSYQRGRSFESSGDYAKAREAYLNDNSAQRQGSVIRARWMDRLISVTSDGSDS